MIIIFYKYTCCQEKSGVKKTPPNKLFLIFFEILVDFFGINIVFALVMERIPNLCKEGVNLCFIIICPAELLLLSLLRVEGSSSGHQ